MHIGPTLRILGGLGAASFAVVALADAPPVHTPAVHTAPVRVAPGTVVGPPDVAKLQCARPGNARGRSYYIDPVAGTDGGDGSKARPWRTLAEVLARPAARAPRFDAGDTLYLLTGDHGDVYVTGRNVGFVAVRPAPGAKPVLQTLAVKGGSYWLFDGLKISSKRNGFAALVLITPMPTVTVDNIVVSNTLISSADDTSGWTQPDWEQRARWFGIRTDDGGNPKAANCITIAHNHITNVIFGTGLATSNSSFTDNVIDYFTGDGLDVAGNYLVIARNRITDNIEGGGGNHNDGIQMQGRASQANRDILIDGNTIIRQTQAATPFPSYLQGISAFNSNWFNVTVTNNVVITNAPHGITFGSVHGGLFANNIVLNDEAKAPNYGVTWLNVSSRTSEGFDAADVVVRNNLAWAIVTDVPGAAVRFDTNIAQAMQVMAGGKKQPFNAPGIVAGDNRVVANIKSLFVDYQPRKYRFDLRPAQPGDSRNWPDRLMAIVGGPAGGNQPGIGGADK